MLVMVKSFFILKENLIGLSDIPINGYTCGIVAHNACPLIVVTNLCLCVTIGYSFLITIAMYTR